MVKPGCEHDRDRYLEALKSIELELLELKLDKHQVLAKKLPSEESDTDLQEQSQRGARLDLYLPCSISWSNLTKTPARTRRMIP